MNLHFKGYGLLVPFTFLGCFVVAEMVSSVITEPSGDTGWVLGAAFSSAGMICWFLGRWLKRRGSLLEDLRRNQEVNPEYCLRSFYWIKMEWWGPIYLSLGLLAFTSELARPSADNSGRQSRRSSISGGETTNVESLESNPGATRGPRAN
jgi:hypothetical protein